MAYTKSNRQRNSIFPINWQYSLPLKLTIFIHAAIGAWVLDINSILAPSSSRARNELLLATVYDLLVDFRRLLARGWIQRKTWCMGPSTGVDYNLTLCRLQSRLQHINHGQHYARVDLNSRLYPPVRDLGVRSLPQMKEWFEEVRALHSWKSWPCWTLKGQLHEMFDFGFSLMIFIPGPLISLVGSISIFFLSKIRKSRSLKETGGKQENFYAGRSFKFCLRCRNRILLTLVENRCKPASMINLPLISSWSTPLVINLEYWISTVYISWDVPINSVT